MPCRQVCCNLDVFFNQSNIAKLKPSANADGTDTQFESFAHQSGMNPVDTCRCIFCDGHNRKVNSFAKMPASLQCGSLPM